MQTKQEKNEYNKLYRINNKEKININRREYYQKNKEKLKGQSKKNYFKNKIKRKEQANNYRKENRETIKKRQKEWYDNNSDKVKEQKLKKCYNLSLTEYNKMFEKQNGKCAICERHQDELKFKLSVDHCHRTNKIRGLLCDKCNRGIGFLNDDKEIVQNALKYLLADL